MTVPTIPPRTAARLATLVAAALAVAVLLLPGDASAAAMEFQSDPVMVNHQTEGAQVGLDLAVGPDDTLYAVWQDGRYVPSSGGNAVFAASSPPDSRGRAFGDGALVVTRQEQGVEQLSPAVAVGPDGTVHVVWQQRSKGVVTPGEVPTFSVFYSRRRASDTAWSDPILLSQPNGRNNTLPSVAAAPGDAAYVAWEVEDYPGMSLALARVAQGSRAWLREDLAVASGDWEVNGDVRIAAEPSGRLHAVWASLDLNGGGVVIGSQVFYAALGTPDSDTTLELPVGVADAPQSTLNVHPALALTSRHGAWVAWAQFRALTSDTGTVHVMADAVVSGHASDDLAAGTFTVGAKPQVRPDVAAGPSDALVIAVAGVGDPVGPPMSTQACSEYGCFAEAAPVVPKGTAAARNATVAFDSLGNAYVGWDDGSDCLEAPRRDSAPGMPQLLAPFGASHDVRPEFSWGFNDPDAGSSQGAFEVQYSPNTTSYNRTSGVVAGSAGKASRWRPPEDLQEGSWHWRVRTRDQLGLWSAWSYDGDFLLDRTPPAVSVRINGGAEYALARTVVLAINASDEFATSGVIMTFEVANDPDFINSSGSHEYPPAGNEFHWDVTPEEGIKVVFVRVTDPSGLSSTAYATIVYSPGLLIVHAPPATAPANEPLNITCEVLRSTDVRAFLYYRERGSKEYERLDMERNASTHWAVVPKADVTTKGLEYYIEATSGPVTTTSPAADASASPWRLDVYEAVDTYVPPIYNPLLAGIGALVITVLLIALWYFRLREPK